MFWRHLFAGRTCYWVNYHANIQSCSATGLFYYYASSKYLSRSVYGVGLPLGTSVFFTLRLVSINIMGFYISSSLWMQTPTLEKGFWEQYQICLTMTQRGIYSQPTANVSHLSNPPVSIPYSSADYQEHLSPMRSLIQCHLAVNMLTHK